MKAIWAAIVIAVVMLAGAPGNASAQAANAWDPIIPQGANRHRERFILLQDFNMEAVLDQETGLVWQHDPDDELRTWNDAQDNCTRAVIGHRMGWRLPTIQELTSLVAGPKDDLGRLPPLPAGHPSLPNMHQLMWSTTTVPTNTDQAYRLSLDNPDYSVITTWWKQPPYQGWAMCVRSGKEQMRNSW